MVIRGSEMLRSVVLLCIGFQNITVSASVTFLIAIMDVAVFWSCWLWGRARACDTILLVHGGQLLLVLENKLR
jgi:hypothetical protein